MICSVCQTECEIIGHAFHVGPLDGNRGPTWKTVAPKYFAMRDRKMVAGFCSALCSLIWYQETELGRGKTQA